MGGVTLPKYAAYGPGIEDCETLMRAIEQVHAGQVQLTVTPVGISANGGLGMVLTYTIPSPTSGVKFEPCLIVLQWPSGLMRDFWSCIYNGLCQLDTMIARRYGSEELPKA